MAQFDDYLPAIKARWLAEQKAQLVRHQRAWALAHQAAKVLKDGFGAQQVIVFGSLVRANLFDSYSDIDLAVSGLQPHCYHRAYMMAWQAVGDFELDLVELEHCPPTIRESILEKGVVL